jgi:hypothetical protein
MISRLWDRESLHNDLLDDYWMQSRQVTFLKQRCVHERQERECVYVRVNRYEYKRVSMIYLQMMLCLLPFV